jgi:peptidyl-tRNA hydrolase
MERFYVIVRGDLPLGDQATQAVHAASAFACDHPELHRAWHTGNKNLILLAVPDEAALRSLYEHAELYPRAHFEEPDIGGELTAIALSGEARRLVSSLPLALKEPKRAA